MISPINSLKLALTKLKIRKTRTIITIIVAGLMFGVLFFAVIVVEGFLFRSLPEFSGRTLSSRNIFDSYHEDSTNLMYGSVKEKDKIKLDQMLEEELVARQRRSKELGLEFDIKQAREELRPYEQQDESGHLFFKNGSVIGRRFAIERNQKIFEDNKKEANLFAKQTGAIKEPVYGTVLANTNLQPFIKRQDGTYKFPLKKGEAGEKYDQRKGTVGEVEEYMSHLSLTPKDIYEPFLFKQNSWRPEEGRVPIILPLDSLEALLGLKKRSKDAKPEENLARLKEVQDKSVGLTFKICFVSNLAQNRHREALVYQKLKPEKQKEQLLAYSPMNQAVCAAPAMLKDARSAEEKKMTAAQEQFAREFDEIGKAEGVKELTFQVVGALPPGMDSEGNFVDTMMRMLSGQIVARNLVPLEMFLQLKNYEDVQTMFYGPKFEGKEHKIVVDDGMLPHFFFEYKSAEEAKKVLDGLYCGEASGIYEDVVKDCKKLKSGFRLYPFGSRAVDLIAIKQIFRKIVIIVGAVMAGISVIIMMGTIGRVIGDGRRETAVFRAIGFKRLDIMAVYLNYGLILSMVVAGFAFLLSLVVAQVVNLKFASSLTAQAAWIYNLQDHSLKFNLVGLNWPIIGVIAGAIVLVGLVSTLLPLIFNIRRNPIRDMREE